MEEVISEKLYTKYTAYNYIYPVGAISIKKSNDGFKYPVIDHSKCIDCGMCKRTCPVINTKQKESLNKCYVGFCNDECIRKKSSSGGIFSVLANYVLKNNGIAIGAGFDENNKLKHMAITKENDLEKIRSSKYLQSDLGDIFKYIKEKLDGLGKNNSQIDSKRQVLFSGTPCQIAGLKSYLQKNYDNLICIDVICHRSAYTKII